MAGGFDEKAGGAQMGVMQGPMVRKDSSSSQPEWQKVTIYRARKFDNLCFADNSLEQLFSFSYVTFHLVIPKRFTFNGDGCQF
jgi:hypothetical protein